MSLARKRKAAQTTIEAKALPAGDSSPETPEPLGTHDNEGNREAREAFLRDEGSGMAVESDAPKDSDEAGATEEIPGLTIEQISHMCAMMIDVAGTKLGPLATKRKDIEWALERSERETVAHVTEPVLRQYIGEEKVTPVVALIGVLLALYVPRAMMALAPPPASESVVDSPPPTASESEKPPPPPVRNGAHGW